MKYHVAVLPDDKNKNTPYKYDEKNVIKTKIPYTQNYHYHVTAIASCVLSNDGDESKPHIDWLLDNMDDDGAYRHDFVFPFYPMQKGWIGGLAQALATSALLYHGYEIEAEKAYSAMKKYCYNGISIEEFPDVEILNGWIYAIFATHDMNDTSFFNENIKNLKNSIYFYDLQRWTRYDTYSKLPSTIFYHNIHIKQMLALSKITGDPYFKRLAERWNSYSKLDVHKNVIKRYAMIVRKHGILGTYNRYRQRKGWMNG